MTKIDRGEVHKLIALPVIGLAVAFLAFFIGTLEWKNNENRTRLSDDIKSEIQLNLRYFAQEIYLGQTEAYQKRLSILNDSFQKRYASSSEICFALQSSNGVSQTEPSKCKWQEEKPFKIYNISVGSEDIASIIVYLKQPKIDLSLVFGIIFPLAGALLLALTFQVFLVKRIFNSIVEPFLLQLSEKERLTAIARTTQFLAHDIRAPFSMFRMIIEAVDRKSNPTEAVQILKESIPEIQQAIASVNSMLSDVLEIGSNSLPIADPTNPETIIEATLNEIFRVYPHSTIGITYNLNHKHKINIDSLKIARVFHNVIANAIQAMNQSGKLWFKTEEIEEKGRQFVLFCIGNSGSFIPIESHSKLFEVFYTSGKKGGTGLGLAIAQKIVSAHGGRIWCESDAQKGVEFYFTLPRCNELVDYRHLSLPINSSEIASGLER